MHRKGHHVKLSIPDVDQILPRKQDALPPPAPTPFMPPPQSTEISPNHTDDLKQSNSNVKSVIIAVAVTAVVTSVLFLLLLCCYQKLIKPRGKIVDDSPPSSHNDRLLKTKIRSDSLDTQHHIRSSQGSVITKVENPALSVVQYEEVGSSCNEGSESLPMVQQQNLGSPEWMGRTGFRKFSNMPSDLENRFAMPYLSTYSKSTVAISSLNSKIGVSNATVPSAMKSSIQVSTTPLYRLPAPPTLTSSAQVMNHVKTKSLESNDSFPGFWQGSIERSLSRSDNRLNPEEPGDLYLPLPKMDDFVVTKYVPGVTYCSIPSSKRSYSIMSSHHIVQKGDHDEVCDPYPVPAPKALRNNAQAAQKLQAIKELVPKSDLDELEDLCPLPNLGNVQKNSTSANSHNFQLSQNSPILRQQQPNLDISATSGSQVGKATSGKTIPQNTVINLHPLPSRPLNSLCTINSQHGKHSQSVSRLPSAISIKQDNVPAQFEAFRLVPSSRLPYRGMANIFSETNIVSHITDESPQPFLASTLGSVSLSDTARDNLQPTSLIVSGNSSRSHAKDDPMKMPPNTLMIERALSKAMPSPNTSIKQMVSQTKVDDSAAAINSSVKTIPPPDQPPLAPPITLSKNENSVTPPPAPPAPPVLPGARKGTPAPPVLSGGRKGPPAPPPGLPPHPPSSLQPHSALDEDGVKLKPFHWEKLHADPSHSMVWHKLKDGSFELNEDEVKMLFPSSTTSKVASKHSRISKVTIIDSKKAQNIAIQLKALNISAHVVCDAILEGDGLNCEQLQALVKMSPSQEDSKQLLGLKNGEQQLGPAESFLKSVLEVPNAFERLEAMKFKSRFKDEVAHLRKSLEILESACDQVRENRLLLKMLEAVLKTGNHMNKGTIRGDAEAFKLDTLLKLSDVKGFDGKTTLMHFVVEEIVKAEGAIHSNHIGSKEDMVRKGLEVVMTLSNDLGIVREAARMDTNELQKCLSNLSNGIGFIKSHLSSLKNQDLQVIESKGHFNSSMAAFCYEAEKDVVVMEQEMSRLFDKLTEAYMYFHGNEREKEPLKLMIIIGELKHLLEKVCKDIAKQHKVKIRD